MDTSKEENLAAKRDARRRRILENAKDRLTRITGRELNADETEKIKGMFHPFKTLYSSRILKRTFDEHSFRFVYSFSFSTLFSISE